MNKSYFCFAPLFSREKRAASRPQKTLSLKESVFGVLRLLKI